MRRLHELDNYDLERFREIAAGFGSSRYGYVVTPNVDHLIRWHDEPQFREYYADAAYVLLDSRFLAMLLKLVQGVNPAVCPGSDITAELFASIISPNDTVVLIGGSGEQAQALIDRHGLRGLQHFNPPMGFARDANAVETCLKFIEEHSPFRFCLLAVGCPQQEMLAYHLQQRGVAKGLVLCIGASINFLTGTETRAPQWMQRIGMEWLYRLFQDPRRLAKRYLIRGPRIFGLLNKTKFVLRAN
ncbi:MAG: WecB/TagA/CpsF family glycosyltransferase [Steroidobacteraceae bacterium]